MGGKFTKNENSKLECETLLKKIVYTNKDGHESCEQESLGSLEDIHKKCRNVFPSIFEGGRIDVNTFIGNHFQIGHNLSLNSNNSSVYCLTAICTGFQQYSSQEYYPVLVGNIDTTGNIHGTILYKFNKDLLTKLHWKWNKGIAGAHLNYNYKGPDYTASITVANQNINIDSAVIIAHFLQKVSKNLSVGAELTYLRGKKLSQHERAVLSLAVQYSNNNYVASLTLNSIGFHTSYYYKANDVMHVGIDLETNFTFNDASFAVGYRINLPSWNLIFKGFLDSKMNVGSTFEKNLYPLPFIMTFSGLMNHVKNDIGFGIGIRG